MTSNTTSTSSSSTCRAASLTKAASRSRRICRTPATSTTTFAYSRPSAWRCRTLRVISWIASRVAMPGPMKSPTSLPSIDARRTSSSICAFAVTSNPNARPRPSRKVVTTSHCSAVSMTSRSFSGGAGRTPLPLLLDGPRPDEPPRPESPLPWDRSSADVEACRADFSARAADDFVRSSPDDAEPVPDRSSPPPRPPLSDRDRLRRSGLERGARGTTRARTRPTPRVRPNRPDRGSSITSNSASCSSTPRRSSAASLASSTVFPVVSTHSTVALTPCCRSGWCCRSRWCCRCWRSRHRRRVPRRPNGPRIPRRSSVAPIDAG